MNFNFSRVLINAELLKLKPDDLRCLIRPSWVSQALSFQANSPHWLSPPHSDRRLLLFNRGIDTFSPLHHAPTYPLLPTSTCFPVFRSKIWPLQRTERLAYLPSRTDRAHLQRWLQHDHLPARRPHDYYLPILSSGQRSVFGMSTPRPQSPGSAGEAQNAHDLSELARSVREKGEHHISPRLWLLHVWIQHFCALSDHRSMSSRLEEHDGRWVQCRVRSTAGWSSWSAKIARGLASRLAITTCAGDIVSHVHCKAKRK